MRAHVILVSGFSGSGKSELARRLQASLRRQQRGPVHILRFSDGVKLFAADLLNAVYGPATPFSAEEMSRPGVDQAYKEKEWEEYRFAGKPLKVRDALIFVGMGMRRHCGDGVWASVAVERVASALALAAEADGGADTEVTFIFDDHRFVSEVRAFFKGAGSIGGVPVRVTTVAVVRGGEPPLGGEPPGGESPPSEAEVGLLRQLPGTVLVHNTSLAGLDAAADSLAAAN